MKRKHKLCVSQACHKRFMNKYKSFNDFNAIKHNYHLICFNEQQEKNRMLTLSEREQIFSDVSYDFGI